MTRILFVDDEPGILDGLRRSLHRQRSVWDMRFVQGGAAALEALEERPAEIVVSDMRMPGMDGAELLKRIAARWPDTLRIVLSGYSEVEAAVRMAPFAHQFLPKPISSTDLEGVMRRLSALRETLRSERLRGVILQFGTLPSPPAIQARLTALLVDPTTSVADLAHLVEVDPAVSAKVLQLANSPFFGPAKGTSCLEQAIAHLGTNLLRGVVLAIEVIEIVRRSPIAGPSIEEAQQHAIASALVSRAIATTPPQADAAFAAGLLHDIGWLMLASRLPAEAGCAYAEAQASGRPQHEVERELLGVSHAEMGAYLLGAWGLPTEIVEAAAYHHEPRRIDTDTFDVPSIVHVAQGLVAAQGLGSFTADGIDAEFVAALGLTARLPVWREKARAIVEACRAQSWG